MTTEFNLLRKRVNEIIQNFSDLIDTYPKEINTKNQDLIKSFILLCHAELENYFETICIKIISKSKALYDDKSIVTKPLFSLSIMSEKNFDEKNKNFTTNQARLDKLYSNYFANIKNNNGIKEENLKKILPHIGIDMDSVDDVLLSQLTAYGVKRGQTAHSTKKVIRGFKDEVASIDSLLKNLEDLDKKFKNLYEQDK